MIPLYRQRGWIQLNQRVTKKVSGLGYTPDMEDWWGVPSEEVQPPHRQKRPRYRQQNLSPAFAPPGKTGRRTLKRRDQALSRALMYVTLGILILCLFLQIGRYAQIAAQTKRISGLVNEIKQLETDKSNLELWLSTRENLKYIQAEAMNNLGMNYPAEGQVRVVALSGLTTDQQSQTAAIPADSAQ